MSINTTLIALKRQALLVSFICYLPHFATEPWWLIIVFLAVIGYSLIVDYFHYPMMPRWLRLVFILGSLSLLNIHDMDFPIRCLLILIIFKFLEINTVRDLKLLVLCNFFLILSALLVIQELWIVIYLLVAVMANLSILMKIEGSQISYSQLFSQSGRLLLLAIPLSLVLFYVFPRIEPFWKMPSHIIERTGFNDTMSMGSVAQVFGDDSSVMQITFKDAPILHGYWRGLVLSDYTGDTWDSTRFNYFSFLPLSELKDNESADYVISLDPHQKKWLFYEGYPNAGSPALVFASNHGLMRKDRENITHRFEYSLKVQARQPYTVLTPTERAEDTQVPRQINPRLSAWAGDQFTQAHNDIPTFIGILHDYIYHQNFWYTLTPPSLSATRNQMDTFWFDTQKGFCEHYASAVTFILRSVGIPARVVVGYQGGDWNPLVSALFIKHKDAHAWLEYWQEGKGWLQLDPTTFIAPQRIDQTIKSYQMNELNQAGYFNLSGLPIDRKIQYYLESVQYFSERWFLFYNKDTQKNLLQYAGLGQWQSEDLFQASVGSLIVFSFLLGLWYPWRQKQALDPILREYQLLQREFQKFKIPISPSATIQQQCLALVQAEPRLRPLVSVFLKRYEELRLRHLGASSKEAEKETAIQFKQLRRNLKKSISK